jgi:Fe-S-cluster containining protein
VTDVERLHAEVDRLAARLEAKHGERLQCRRGCASCCVDGITVFEVEADVIRRHHAELLAKGAPHAEGACAFLDDEGACRIYEHRPYVCRTQGLPLRWLEELDDETVELRDICPLNEEGEPIEELDEEECWTIGPVEERLARIQAATGSVARVELRELFAPDPIATAIGSDGADHQSRSR